MKNNQGILNLTEKKIYFRFNDEDFVMDLTEGDLHDSWNSFVTKDDVVRDLNFSWEGYSAGTKPSLTIYELRENEDGTWSTDVFSNTDVSVKFTEIIGTEGQYFDIPFDGVKTASFEVVGNDGEVILKTKKFNKACDFSIIHKANMICIDVYGNKKNLTTKEIIL